MNEWFASGHAVDLVLAFIAIEAIWLCRRGWKIADAAVLLLPGVCMLIALRLALIGAAWPGIALALTLSLPFHLADIARRSRVR